jgi:hypothetical protein
MVLVTPVYGERWNPNKATRVTPSQSVAGARLKS